MKDVVDDVLCLHIISCGFIRRQNNYVNTAELGSGYRSTLVNKTVKVYTMFCLKMIFACEVYLSNKSSSELICTSRWPSDRWCPCLRFVVIYAELLVHGQVTIIFVVSVCLSLCRVFLSRLWSDCDQTRTYVICLGL